MACSARAPLAGADEVGMLTGPISADGCAAVGKGAGLAAFPALLGEFDGLDCNALAGEVPAGFATGGSGETGLV